MSIEYFGLLMYDFPMQTDVEIFEYRTFRKKIDRKGVLSASEIGIYNEVENKRKNRTGRKTVINARSRKFLNSFHYPDRRSVSKNEGTCRRSDNGRENFTK